MRLFIAINFDEAVKDRLQAVQGNLRGQLASGRLTGRDNLHLTLAFIGETPPEAVADITAALSAINAEAFGLALNGLGAFNRGKSMLLWMGVAENPALTALQKQVAECLMKAGVGFDRKKFSPHLTLIRNALPANNFNINALSRETPGISVFVSGCSLMLSAHVNGRLTYTELFRQPLKGGQHDL